MLDGGRHVRRVFFEIVRRMEPNDAILLRTISRVAKAAGSEGGRLSYGAPLEDAFTIETLAELKLLKFPDPTDIQLSTLGREFLRVCMAGEGAE